MNITLSSTIKQVAVVSAFPHKTSRYAPFISSFFALHSFQSKTLSDASQFHLLSNHKIVFRIASMASKTAAAKDIITLHGSAAIVSEFFCYAANRWERVSIDFNFQFWGFLSEVKKWNWIDFVYSILYNRAVYPEESFAKVKKYGLPMLLTQDESVKSFLSNLTSQISGKN